MNAKHKIYDLNAPETRLGVGRVALSIPLARACVKPTHPALALLHSSVFCFEYPLPSHSLNPSTAVICSCARVTSIKRCSIVSSPPWRSGISRAAMESSPSSSSFGLPVLSSCTLRGSSHRGRRHCQWVATNCSPYPSRWSRACCGGEDSPARSPP